MQLFLTGDLIMDIQNNDDKNIARMMKYYRQLKNISQEDLSNLSGINLSTIKKYEVGIRRPKYEQLEKIAEALGINVNHFYNTEYKTVGDVMSTIVSMDRQIGLDITAAKDESGAYNPDSIQISFKDQNIKKALSEYLSLKESDSENANELIAKLLLSNIELD